MIRWWLSLNIYEHIMLTIALASTMIVLIKMMLHIFKFNSVDKLNLEPEELENYEKIANHDSDLEKHIPRMISIVGINVFLMSTCWSYFFFILFTSRWNAALWCILFGIFCMIVYSIIRHFIKKNKKQKHKNLTSKV